MSCQVSTSASTSAAVAVGTVTTTVVVDQRQKQQDKGELQQRQQQQPHLSSNLNLRHNDNAFHVLASLLIDFFQSKLVQMDHTHEGNDTDSPPTSTATIVLELSDKKVVQRILPKSVVWDFIDAVNYRLEMTPVVPVLPIHFITIQCQQYGFDQERTIQNPILSIYKMKESDHDDYDPTTTVIVNVLPISVTPNNQNMNHPKNTVDWNPDDDDDSEEEVTTTLSTTSTLSKDHPMSTNINTNKINEANIDDDDDDDIDSDSYNIHANGNGDNVGSNGSDLSSSSNISGIKVASSRDIAEEMLLAAREQQQQQLSKEVDSHTPIVVEDHVDENTNEDSNNKNCTIDDNLNVNTVNWNVININNDDDVEVEEVGEEIDLLPTISGSYNNDNDDDNDNGDDDIDDDNNDHKDVALDDTEQPNTTETILDEPNICSHQSDVCSDKNNEIDVLPSIVEDTLMTLPTNSLLDNRGSIISNNHVEPTNELVVDDTDKNLTNSTKEYDNIQVKDIPEVSTVQSNTLTSNHDKEVIVTVDESMQHKNIDATVIDPARDDNDDDGDAVLHPPTTPQWFDGTKNAIHDAANSFYGGLEKVIVNAIVASPINEPLKSSGPSTKHNDDEHSNVDDIKENIATSLYDELEKTIVNAIVAKPDDTAYKSIIKKSTVTVESTKSVKSSDVVAVENTNKVVQPNSPSSFSIQSGFTSLFVGLAGGFSPSIKGTDSRSTNEKNIMTTAPSDESASRMGGSEKQEVIDISVYEKMVVRDTVIQQQLILELNEACTLMKQSITPETSRFWREHIQILKERLEALQIDNNMVVAPIMSQHIDNNILDSPREFDCTTAPFVASDLQSAAAMSAKGIPVVQARSQFSTNCIGYNEYAESTDKPIFEHPAPAEDSRNDTQVYSQVYDNSEIELSNSRNQYKVNPSDEIYSQQSDSHQQESIQNDEGYYEYPLVDVVAPADLPGGYHFEAEIEGQRFLATVPPGGVQQGETFTCYMKELDSVAIDIPVGEWKDGLCNICELGWCHPVLWNAMFCPLIALGQIQSRVHLDFLGRPKFGDLQYSNRYMMLMVISFWVITNGALFAACNLKWSHGLELSVADGCAFVLVNVAMFGFVVFVTQSTRSSVREKFMIRERCCYDLEDVCCATLCLPCTVGQMQRHTANYDDYEAVCCSKTGLPNGVRVNQEPAKVKEITLENEDGFMV